MTILAENVPLWLKNVSGLVPANSQLGSSVAIEYVGRVFTAPNAGQIFLIKGKSVQC